MILLIDNYDSFTYNLYQYICELSAQKTVVIRNDDISADEILAMEYERLVISPGPGRPEKAGVCLEIIKKETKRPILGVCLGHQAVCLAYGINITYAAGIFHGKRSYINIIRDSKLFRNMERRIEGARYHSLAADRTSDFSEIIVTSVTDDGEIMSVEHRDLPVFGIQFHPESILTSCGKKILSNFLEV